MPQRAESAEQYLGVLLSSSELERYEDVRRGKHRGQDSTLVATKATAMEKAFLPHRGHLATELASVPSHFTRVTYA